MNEYGERAMRYWQRWLPGRFDQIPPLDRLTFFTQLGQQVQEQIALTEESLLASDPGPDLGYLDQVGRLTAIRARAREIVEKEMVFLDPETGADPDLDRPDRHPLAAWMDPQGMPLDRSHPLWAMHQDQTVSLQEFAAAAAAWEDDLWHRLEDPAAGEPETT